jgi:GAF domain-containing protein
MLSPSDRSGRTPPDGTHVPVDRESLTRALDALGPVMTPERTIGAALPEFLAAVCGVFGVTGAGLMLMDEQSGLRYVASTDDGAAVLERVQEQAGVGPCVESFVNDVEILVPDLADDDRWPSITEPLLAAGIRSVLGVPTRLGGGPVGSLNVYGAAARAWDESERDAIQSFNTVVEAHISSAVALRHHGRVVEQLQYALDNRVTIERAIGMLMARHDVDAVAAFHHLRSASRTARRKVADVAREIVQGTPEPRS